MAFVTDADVKVAHDRINAEWSAAAQAASAESQKMTADEIVQMGILAARVSALLADSPSLLRAASQMNAAEALERDVFTWVASLRASGVDNLPQAPAGPTPSAIDKVVDYLPMIVLALIVLEFAGKGRR